LRAYYFPLLYCNPDVKKKKQNKTKILLTEQLNFSLREEKLSDIVWVFFLEVPAPGPEEKKHKN
jgi:hypothetical protein